MIQVKVCCILNTKEAQMAIDAGADAIGLVSAMPSGPGVIRDDEILEIAHFAKNKIDIFLLTSQTSGSTIIQQFHAFSPDYLQLVDYVSEKDYRILRSRIPIAKLIQVIHVIDDESLDMAIHYSKLADGLLLDSGNPNQSTKILGGTGKVHNWELSRKIVDAVKIPVFLAGGLNPQNISAACQQVQPYGVDLCSGIREKGLLRESKLKEFISKVRCF
jgi:phosphoribosylanthranilate isomerase